MEVIVLQHIKIEDPGYIKDLMLSDNVNLTMNVVENNPNKTWSWNWISEHLFTRDRELFFEKWYRIYMAVFRLQQYFNRMYDNPKYQFCRERLEKSFNKIGAIFSSKKDMFSALE